MAERMAALLGAEYFPVSSKTGENIELFFRRLAVLCFEMGLAEEVKENISGPGIAQSPRTSSKRSNKLPFEKTKCCLPF